jgi:uncharacterized membrane protein (DUF4010 family)
MAARVKQAPDLLRPAAAGAVLSTVATIVELALLLAATSMAALAALCRAAGLRGVVAVLYGGLFTLWALKQEGSGDEKPGRAFSLATALALAATLSVILGCLGGAAGAGWEKPASSSPPAWRASPTPIRRPYQPHPWWPRRR